MYRKPLYIFILLAYCSIFSCTAESDILTTIETTSIQQEQRSPSQSGADILTLAQKIRGIWIIGGTDGSSLLSEVELYDPISDTWYSNVTTFPSPRQNFAIASGLGKIYIFGGAVSGAPVDRVDIFDPLTMTWTTGPTDSDNTFAQPNNATTSVRGASAVYTDGRFFLMGGYDGSDVTRQLYEFNPATDTWAQRNGNTGINYTVEDTSACISMGATFAMGGRDGNTVRYYTTYNYTSYTYTQLVVTQHRIHYPEYYTTFGASCESLARQIYFVGGSTSYTSPTGRDDFFVLDIVLLTWTTKSSMNQKRYYHDSAIVDDVLYVFGGTENHTNATALDSVEAYDILTDTGWIAKTAMPRARFAFGATTVVMQ